ncbi:MAG: tetratricopeptide repeat protein, partial [Chitinophagales bacterium]
MKTFNRLLIILAISMNWVTLQAQQVKKTAAKNPVQLGDQYFAAGEYYTAAHLYGQFLNPSKKQIETTDFPLNIKGKRIVTTNKVSRNDILFKQAESYRLANYWQEAAKAYKECSEKDPDKYNEALYWYAVCQRSLGNYTAAGESLEQYLILADENSDHKEAAKKELQTLNFIREQLARPDSILFTTKKLNTPTSNERGAFAPILVNGNQYLISSTEADSIKIKGMNPNHSRLFYATLDNGSFQSLTPVTIPGSDPMINQGAGAISADGKYLYFSQWKKEKGQTVSSIYYSTKEAGGWSAPTPIPSINTNGSNSKQPFCSADGKYLFFASDRPGGSGGFDIWYASLNNDGTTGEPINAGTAINSTADEQAPFYHNSSTTLVFSSNGRQGMGGYDLFTAKGSEMTWSAPENMG